MAESGQKVSGDASHNRGKKRAKSFYIRSKEGKRIRKDVMLSVGMKGILLTCNHGVKPCIKEAYNLLNEYADQLYGPEKDEEEEGKEAASEEEDEEEDDDCDDMEASLQKEIAGMKKQRKARQQRFQAVDSGAKNVAFIKAKIDNPCELVHRVLTDIQQTKTSKSRHIMRMLPVTATFRSYIEDIEKQAPRVLKPHFECEDGKVFSFCIKFKVRNCGHLKRDDVITTLHRLVTDMGRHTVDLSNADKVILVEGVRNVCCISVLTDFFKLRKYNLQEIVEEFNDGTKEKYRWKRKPQKTTSNSESQVTDNKDKDSVAKAEEKSAESQVDSTTDGSNGDKEPVGQNVESETADVEKATSEDEADTADAGVNDTGSNEQTNETNVVPCISDENVVSKEAK